MTCLLILFILSLIPYLTTNININSTCIKIFLCRPLERIQVPPKVMPPKAVKRSGLEYFLLSLSPSVLERNMDPKLNRMLEKYRKRKEKWEKRSDLVRK